MKDLIDGVKYLLSGFKLITKPGIRLYVLIPLLVNSLLFAIVIIYGANQLDSLMTWLTAKWHWLEWLSWLLWPLFLIITMTVVFFCFSILANLIAAPFNGFLAEAVATRLTGNKASNSSSLSEMPGEIMAALKSEFQKFLYFATRALPLLILFVIPVVTAVAPVIWFLFGSWMLALEYIEFPMGNRGRLFPDIRDTLGKHRRLAFGFGMGALVLTMIPVVNFIVMPVAVAGATRLWADRIMDREVPAI